jgi:LysR family glycine cleavage system transcriptional activator
MSRRSFPLNAVDAFLKRPVMNLTHAAKELCLTQGRKPQNCRLEAWFGFPI